VSAINGAAIGAGLCLALATDLRIAAKDAKLGVTFTALGFHPGMGASHFLPLLAGNQVSTRMLLMGEVLTGEEAKQNGLVLDAVDQDKGRDIYIRALTLQYFQLHSPWQERLLTNPLLLYRPQCALFVINKTPI
jgi:enoyl-CoA hydratase/carnithine racemase